MVRRMGSSGNYSPKAWAKQKYFTDKMDCVLAWALALLEIIRDVDGSPCLSLWDIIYVFLFSTQRPSSSRASWVKVIF